MHANHGVNVLGASHSRPFASIRGFRLKNYAIVGFAASAVRCLIATAVYGVDDVIPNLPFGVVIDRREPFVRSPKSFEEWRIRQELNLKPSDP